MEIENLDILIPLVGVIVSLVGAQIWVVKYIVDKSASNVQVMISLLSRAVDNFEKFQAEEDTTHKGIIAMLTAITNQQKVISDTLREISRNLNN